jgi:hypothetical protein
MHLLTLGGDSDVLSSVARTTSIVSHVKNGSSSSQVSTYYSLRSPGKFVLSQVFLILFYLINFISRDHIRIYKFNSNTCTMKTRFIANLIIELFFYNY